MFQYQKLVERMRIYLKNKNEFFGTLSLKWDTFSKILLNIQLEKKKKLKKIKN
jgi:hypothetical protein